MCGADDRLYRSRNRRHDRRFFYKYVSAQVAKIVLATRTLRWSSPLLFNDPFDVTQELRLNFDEAELNAAIAMELAALIEEADPSFSARDPRLKVLLRVLNSQRDSSVRRRVVASLRSKPIPTTVGQIEAFADLRQMWRDLVPRFRVLCLSELKDVTSMWQHYADSYRGAVLEFEAVDQLDSAFLVARPVTYQDSPPAIASKEVWARCLLGRGQTSYEDLFTDLQYIKTTAWAYEREWRIVTMARPEESGLFYDFPFQPRELTGVYFGASCGKEKEAEILSLLTHGLEHVSAYRAHVDGTEAKFRFDEIG